ncbi:hypothetical protein BKA59DRAFT_210473 [Fusarium tricinctum]|uniref:Uncharacterized protein n=1 Tax=Fusarium tricinctum TaxID=61284 RepID=A0A8K0W9B9_9HYPO|nr:hypothetical protein BKA59DRAFT_210473 [Fusarium tricinctum]
MDQMKEAALQAAYIENENADWDKPDESFTAQPPTAQAQVAPVAQPIPDESFTSQLPADDEAMPGLISDNGSDAQPSPSFESFPQMNNYGFQDMLNDSGDNDFLNIYPPLPSGDAEIGLQFESTTDPENPLMSSFINSSTPDPDNPLMSSIVDPPTTDLDNPFTSSTTVSSGSYVCPSSGVDFGPVVDFLNSNDLPPDQLPPDQLPSDQLPSDHATQLEVDPSLANPVEDDVDVSVRDPNTSLSGSHRYAPASPESAFEDA